MVCTVLEAVLVWYVASSFCQDQVVYCEAHDTGERGGRGGPEHMPSHRELSTTNESLLHGCWYLLRTALHTISKTLDPRSYTKIPTRRKKPER